MKALPENYFQISYTGRAMFHNRINISFIHPTKFTYTLPDLKFVQFGNLKRLLENIFDYPTHFRFSNIDEEEVETTNKSFPYPL